MNMLWLEDDQLNVSFPDVHELASCKIVLQRTLRIPDDGKTYSLPAGLGRFPLRHIEDFSTCLPSELLRRGGLIMPMWQAEALWINFRSDFPFAVKVATGKINAVTGGPWKSELQGRPQDYLVIPRQPWLDGYCVENGKIRQFVAAPLGKGHTVEEQVSGAAAEWGGIQLVFYPIEASRWRSRELVSHCMKSQAAYSDSLMGIAAGGLMRQEIYEDSEGIEAWDQQHSARCFITILNAQQWSELTGDQPPTRPITAEQYQKHGLPWFDWYDKDQKAVTGGKILSGVKPLPVKEESSLGGMPMTSHVKHLGPHRRPITEFQDFSPETELNRIEAKLDDALRSILLLREQLALLLKMPKPPTIPRPKARFFIEFNGKTIERETAAETMADFLEAIGLERVARLGLRIAKLPLVSHNEPPKDRGSCKRRGWVIVTHASNADKKALLEQVADELGLQARVRIVQPIEPLLDHSDAAE